VTSNKPENSGVPLQKNLNKEQASVAIPDSLVSFNDVDERMGDVDDRNKQLEQKQQAQPTFPTSKLNELNALISESASKGSAKDFLANLLKASQPPPPVQAVPESLAVESEQQQLSDKLLQDSKNSLNELQKQLSISQSNDAATVDKSTSKNTQQLLEMIGTILEMTQKKLMTEQQISVSKNLFRFDLIKIVASDLVKISINKIIFLWKNFDKIKLF